MLGKLVSRKQRYSDPPSKQDHSRRPRCDACQEPCLVGETDHLLQRYDERDVRAEADKVETKQGYANRDRSQESASASCSDSLTASRASGRGSNTNIALERPAARFRSRPRGAREEVHGPLRPPSRCRSRLPLSVPYGTYQQGREATLCCTSVVRHGHGAERTSKKKCRRVGWSADHPQLPLTSRRRAHDSNTQQGQPMIDENIAVAEAPAPCRASGPER